MAGQTMLSGLWGCWLCTADLTTGRQSAIPQQSSQQSSQASVRKRQIVQYALVKRVQRCILRECWWVQAWCRGLVAAQSEYRTHRGVQAESTRLTTLKHRGTCSILFTCQCQWIQAGCAGLGTYRSRHRRRIVVRPAPRRGDTDA